MPDPGAKLVLISKLLRFKAIASGDTALAGTGLLISLWRCSRFPRLVPKEIDWIFYRATIRSIAHFASSFPGGASEVAATKSLSVNSLDANDLMQSCKLFGIPTLNSIDIVRFGPIAVFRRALLSAVALLLCCFSAPQAQAIPEWPEPALALLSR